MGRHLTSILCERSWLVFPSRKRQGHSEVYIRVREGERTILQSRDTLKGHDKVL